jgi:hypothetical protein
MTKFYVSCDWVMETTVEVEAATEEEAIEQINNLSRDEFSRVLAEGEFSKGSFEIADIEEAETS